MKNWRKTILTGVVATGMLLVAGVQTQAALPAEGSHSRASAQADAAERPRILDGESVIYLDGKDQITVEGKGISAISYASDDSRVAKIDGRGIVTPVSEGKTKIRATVTCVISGVKKTEALSYDLQVLPKSTEYFKYDSDDYVGKSRIVGLTAKGKRLRDVYIPGWCQGKKVLEVHKDVFKNDVALEKVYVADNLIYLDYWRWPDDYEPGENFSGCGNLRELHLGRNLKGVGRGFAASLEKITVDERNKTFRVQDNVLFSGTDRLVCYPGARKDAFYQIPDGIKTVEEDAFYGAANLKKVGFPKGIEEILNAFRHAGLTEVVVPDTVKYYGGAFAHCGSLEKVTIETVEWEYVWKAFEGCGKLKSIFVRSRVSGNLLNGSSVEEICLTSDAWGVSVKDGVLFSEDGKELYAYPPGKKAKYVLPAGTEKIADDAFRQAQISEVALNQGLKQIGESAFVQSAIRAIALPDSVTKLGFGVFEECGKLRTVKLSKNLEEIPSYTFWKCVSLEKLHIPKKVKKFGISMGCKKLKAYTVEKGNASYVAVKGVLYSKSKKTIYSYPPAKKGKKYTILKTVRKIEGSAFADNRYLQTVSMGNRVTYCGSGAFSDGASLKKVTLSKNISKMGEYVFARCKKLQAVTVPDKVKRLECGTFMDCTAIKRITLGKKVKFVDVWNFKGCKSLQKLNCRSLIVNWNFGACVGGSFEKAGSKNYKKLVVRFPKCKSGDKRNEIKSLVREAGLNMKAKIVFGK